MTVLWAILLCGALATGWILTLLGMPGNWLIVAATAVYALIVPADSVLAIGRPVILILIGLRAGRQRRDRRAGSRRHGRGQSGRRPARGAVLALIGSVAGGIVGVLCGLPIPLVGSVLAAVLFASLEALAGTVLGESWKGRGLEDSLQVGKAAFWGRLFGTLAKTLVGSVMAGVVLAALVWP